VRTAADESLSKHKGSLSLDGLTSLSDGPGHLALATKLYSDGGEIELNSLGSDTISVPFPGKSPIQSDFRIETMS